MVIFNRSHYEDVLVVRVHKLVPKAVWAQRYREINDFERMLSASGVTILKRTGSFPKSMWKSESIGTTTCVLLKISTTALRRMRPGT
jgi:hypothetical protein